MLARTRRQYAAEVTALDEAIGDILAAPEARGEAEHTFIIFTSDHGEMLGDLGLYAKSVPYESALRVPLLISGPGIRRGRSDALVELADCNPTICAMAGLPPQADLDARDLSPLLAGSTATHREVVTSQLRNFRTVRSRDEKLIAWSDGASELYRIEEDPSESDDHSAAAPDRVQGLWRMLRQEQCRARTWRY